MWRSMVVALAVGSLGVAASGQAPGGVRPVVVTSDGAFTLQTWRAGSAGFEKEWEAAPRSALADAPKRRAEAVLTGRDAPPVIADADGDGSSDLVILDALGITVYGATPAYYPFETVALDTYAQALVVADLDGDGSAELVTSRQVEKGREIEVWKREGAGLRRVGRHFLEGVSPVLLWADADNDGKGDLVTTSPTGVLVLRPAGQAWEVAADLAHDGGAPSAVRVADLDGDGATEIVAAGSNGKVTVYGQVRRAGRRWHAVTWQSPYLLTPGLRPRGDTPPAAYGAALATGDVDGDLRCEILATANEIGMKADRDEPATSRVRLFRFDGRRDYEAAWTSDWAPAAGATALATGDLDADGRSEVVVSGRQLYRHDPATGGLRLDGTACPTCIDGAIGALPGMREPTGVLRLVPVYWSLRNRQLVENQPADLSITLYSPWAEATDVTVSIAGPESNVVVSAPAVHVAAVPAGGTAVTPPLRVTVPADQSLVTLRLEITAAGGYRQVIPVRAYVTPAPPDYEAGDIASRIAAAGVRARDENRRVLVIWGARAEAASAALLEAVRKTPDVSRTLLYEYEVVRADVGRDRAAAARYGARPASGGLPWLTVLDASGKVVANQAASAFRGTAADKAAPVFDAARLNAFLKQHQAAYLDAKTIFDEALSRAKREQKTLFVWFSAPW